METRLDKNRRLKRQSLFKKFKLIIIFTLISLMTMGLNVVNKTIVELNCIDKPILLRYDLSSGYLDLLGKTYIINLEPLKNIF